MLDRVATESEATGIDTTESTRNVRDHIEASKIVQHAWHQYWAAYPDRAPANPPELDEIRPSRDCPNDRRGDRTHCDEL